MDEREASLTTAVVSYSPSERKNFSESDLIEADRVYALNRQVAHVSAVIQNDDNEDSEEAEDMQVERSQNEAAIMRLLEQDINEVESIKTTPSVVKHRETLSRQVEAVLEGVSDLTTRVLLGDVLDVLTKTGMQMEVIGLELLEENPSDYTMEISVKHFSSLSRGGEKYMISYFEKHRGTTLSFSQTFIKEQCKRIIDIRVNIR